MDWRAHIVCDPKILMGKPSVKGTRISVELILGWLSAGWSIDQLLDAYPSITRDHVFATLAYARELAHDAGNLPMTEAAGGVMPQGDAEMGEIVFVVEQATEGWYTARALGDSIFTEADTLEELRTSVQDAVHCHFDERASPRNIRLHFVRDEMLVSK